MSDELGEECVWRRVGQDCKFWLYDPIIDINYFFLCVTIFGFCDWIFLVYVLNVVCC